MLIQRLLITAVFLFGGAVGALAADDETALCRKLNHGPPDTASPSGHQQHKDLARRQLNLLNAPVH